MVNGTITQSSGVFPGSLGKRDFRVEGSDKKIVLIFPIGKRPLVGEKNSFFLLPDTNIAVDVQKSQNQSEQ